MSEDVTVSEVAIETEAATVKVKSAQVKLGSGGLYTKTPVPAAVVLTNDHSSPFYIYHGGLLGSQCGAWRVGTEDEPLDDCLPGSLPDGSFEALAQAEDACRALAPRVWVYRLVKAMGPNDG